MLWRMCCTLLGHRISNCHGSWVPGPILTVSCLCAYVWAGVCGCVWLRLIRSSWESSPLGYICSCHALPFVRSLQCLRSSFTVRSGSAIPEPCCFLDSDRRTLAAHCFPALPASALRKAPHLPTESSVSAYGSSASALRKAPLLPYGKLRFCLRKLRLCLRKAPFLPTEAPPLPYGKLRFCLRKLRLCPTESSASANGSSASALRKAPFSFSLCITSCNKLSFRYWILPSSLWQKHKLVLSSTFTTVFNLC